MSFVDLGLAESLLRAVSSEGYTTPTPIQLQAIPHALAGRDLLACAQTGTGKTAAFALPLLQRLSISPAPANRRPRPLRALILSPTRELAAQIGDCFAAYGRHTSLKHTVVFGGVGQHPQVRALRHGVDILTATPGRLLDLFNQGFVDFAAVDALVLDEADRMLDMGFLPDIKRIVSKLPRERQTLLFSATMPEPIARLADTMLRDPVHIRIAPQKATTALIDESICFVPKAKKMAVLVELLEREPISRALVFTRTKHGADRVARQLNRAGISADSIHGDKSQNARQRALAAFKSNHPPVLVATDVAARGIDVDGVSHVFNYEMPLEAEMYLHRIGRTGRAGAEGVAISLCDPDERKLLVAIERLTRRSLPQTLGMRDVIAQAQPVANEAKPRHARKPQTASAQRTTAPGPHQQDRKFDRRRPGKSRRERLAARW